MNQEELSRQEQSFRERALRSKTRPKAEKAEVELELAELEKALRERDFKVKVNREQRGLYPDEIRVSVTHNGYQWNSMLMNEAEARMIYQAIAAHFGWENPWCRNTERRRLPFPIICPYTSCQRTFTTREDLWAHVKEHLRKENTEHELRTDVVDAEA